jgi:hypothetical protein
MARRQPGVVSRTAQVEARLKVPGSASDLSGFAHDGELPPRQATGMTKAVVIGGGIGGLLTSLVLAGVCDRVLLVERGELPDTPMPRAGVPSELAKSGAAKRRVVA